MAKTLRATEPKAAKPSKPKVLIFGKPGVGKTWASLDFPGVYYIDVEGGANRDHYTDKLHAAGGKYLGPSEGSNDFAVVLDEIQTLATIQHPFKTLVIDSFSKLFQSQIAATAEAMDKANKKNEFGADKKPAVAYSRRMIRWFEKLDMNVVLVCHEKDKWTNGEAVGQTFDGWDKLEYELDLCLNITKAGNSRNAKVVKSRLIQFPDASAFPWSYEEFSSRYGKKVMEADAAPARMATDEQIKLYTALLENVKVDPKVLEKWAENCEDLSELDYDGMQKRLDYLNAKLAKPAA